MLIALSSQRDSHCATELAVAARAAIFKWIDLEGARPLIVSLGESPGVMNG